MEWKDSSPTNLDEKVKRTRTDADFMQRDGDGRYHYILIQAGLQDGQKRLFALDNNYTKIDTTSVEKFSKFKFGRFNIAYLENVFRKSTSSRDRYNYFLVDFYEMLGIEKKRNPKEAYAILLKRSKTGMPRFIELADKDGNATKKEMKLSLALVVDEALLYGVFEDREMDVGATRLFPRTIIPDDPREYGDCSLIPVVNLRECLTAYRETLFSRYHQLKGFPSFRKFLNIND